MLNRCLFDLNTDAYFSVASQNKWGDVLMSLADTKTVAIAGYYPAMREALGTLGLVNFTFARDVEKVKVYVGMVLLSRLGGGWEPEHWESVGAFGDLTADIECSNPEVNIAARPSWAGHLRTLKDRKANIASLILVLEMTKEVRGLMAGSSPRLVVSGRQRQVRILKKHHPTIVCIGCQTVGHKGAECHNKAICAFCRKEHITADHKYLVTSCGAVGAVCAHVRRGCILCGMKDHFTGHLECAALRGSSSSPPVMGTAAALVANHTSVTGMADSCRNDLNHEQRSLGRTPLADVMMANNASVKNIREVVPIQSIRNPAHNRVVSIPEAAGPSSKTCSPSAPPAMIHKDIAGSIMVV